MLPASSATALHAVFAMGVGLYVRSLTHPRPIPSACSNNRSISEHTPFSLTATAATPKCFPERHSKTGIHLERLEYDPVVDRVKETNVALISGGAGILSAFNRLL
jgi:hypothetical protein